MDDPYLTDLTADQALTLLRGMATYVSDGDGFQPVGHYEADAFAADLLGIHDAARCQRPTFDDGLRRSVELHPRVRL